MWRPPWLGSELGSRGTEPSEWPPRQGGGRGPSDVPLIPGSADARCAPAGYRGLSSSALSAPIQGRKLKCYGARRMIYACVAAAGCQAAKWRDLIRRGECMPTNFIYLFIYFWLCWVFISVRGLSLVAASGGHSSSRCAVLSLSRPLLLRSTGSRRAGSVVVAHGPSCSVACGIFPDQGSNPCPLH